MFVVFLVSTSLVSQYGLTQPAYADTTTWARTYANPNEPSALSVQQTSDGGYITTGFGFDMLKVDPEGSVEWTNAYHGITGDFFMSIDETAEGGYIAAGSTWYFDMGQTDFWLVKLDSDGNVEWQKVYGGTGSDDARSVQQTNDGGYIVAGRTTSFGEEAAWVLKLDSDGNVEWEKAYGGPFGENAQSVHQTSDGGFVVAGWIDASGVPGESTDFWVLKLDSDGNVEWDRRYGATDSSEFGFSVQQTSDGGYIVAGSGPTSDLGVLKLDSDGNIVWEKTYGNGREHRGSIQQTSDGGYILAGTTSLYFAPPDFSDPRVLKLDSDGNVEWDNVYRGVLAGALTAGETSDGGYIVGGGGKGGFSLLKLDSAGNMEDCRAKDLIITLGDAVVTDIDSAKSDRATVVVDTSAAIEHTSAGVFSVSPKIFGHCGPAPTPFYQVDLFEHHSEPIDAVAPGQEVRAVATTSDNTVDRVAFTWNNPAGDTMQENVIPGEPPLEDFFTPEEPGVWTVEADFGNGQVIVKTVSVSFFVLPESPIGAVATVIASMGALGGFLYFKSRKPSVIK